MALLSVRIVPDPCLYTPAQLVECVDEGIRRLLDDMLETMYANNGCGLAANQVGVLKRVIVMDVSPEPEPPKPIKLINPEILWTSEEEGVFPQGCLSVPDQYAE